MTHERAEFGSRLRERREARSLTLVEVARATKIPEKTLSSLEEGAFEQLPADVFVRGFLRSYCRCVGLDPDDILRRWNDIMRDAGERPEITLTRPAPARSSAPPPPKAVEPAEAKQDEQSLLSALSDASRGTSRISLTVAVIILVIVATLTLSLLLRRPSHVGDGVSWLRSPAARVV